MSSKQHRRRYISELVTKEDIHTQREMIAALERMDVTVSQATLSKDIKEMGLVKIPRADGTFRYGFPDRSGATTQKQRVLERELLDFLVRFDSAGNLLVLKTTQGNAQGVCAALDEVQWPEILGTIAGDDTILVISKTACDTERIMEQIREVLGE